MNNRSEELNNKVKTWLFPSLVTVLAALIWRDVTELKSDVKSLLAQSNIDKTRINNIERELYDRKTITFFLGRSPEKDSSSNFLYYNKELALVDNKDKKKPSVYLKKAKNGI
jgi:hypothetical protein